MCMYEYIIYSLLKLNVEGIVFAFDGMLHFDKTLARVVCVQDRVIPSIQFEVEDVEVLFNAFRIG